MSTLLKKPILILLILTLLPEINFGQQFFRISADFSIKEKIADGTSRLIVGKVYYDLSAEKIIYDISFPEPETWVLKDTTLYRFQSNELLGKSSSFVIPTSSFFHFTLSGQLANFGLRNSGFTIIDVAKKEDQILTTWEPEEEKVKSSLGKVIMSNLDKKLQAIAFYNPDNDLLSKQFYKNYTNVSGCEVPTEITQINYHEQGQNYQVTSYKKEMKLFTITSFLICSLIGVTFAQSNNEVLAYKDLLTEKKKAVHYKAAEENKNEIETVFSGLFKVYKNFISSQDGSNCVFYPSCSEYGLLAVKKYGVLLGTANDKVQWSKP